MRELNYPRQSEGSYQINSASYISQKDIDFIRPVSVLKDIPFDSPYHAVEVSAYDISNGELINWELLTSSINHDVQNGGYTNLDGNFIDYEYVTRTSNFPVIKTGEGESSFILDPAKDIDSLGLNGNSYTLVYNMVLNVAGNPNNKFEVLNVSSDRTEVHAILENIDNDESLLRLQSFTENIPLISEIAPRILKNITSVKFSDRYFDVRDNDLSLVDTLLHTYGFKVDINFVNFLSQVYSDRNRNDVFTVDYQFRNYLYSNFNTILSYDTIYKKYYDIVDHVVRLQLNRITNFPVFNKDAIIEFVKSIYLSVYKEVVSNLQEEISIATDGVLKTFFNFGNNNLLMVLNHKSSTNKGELFIKLRDPLPDGEVENFYISKLVIDPIILKTSLYSITEIGLTDLKPANFNIDSTSAPTKKVSSDEIVKSNNSVRSELQNSKSNIDIDYTDFNNFVAFSSAEIRLFNYKQKLKHIHELSGVIEQLQSENFDTYRSVQIAELSNNINSITQKFDGYERFLYDNPEYVTKHSAVSAGGLSVTQEYDRSNSHSLRNNLAEYIIENTENFEFLKFVDMIGQSFDEIFNYINSFTRNKKVEHSKTLGASDDIVNSMLSMLGWDNSGVDDSELLLNLYGENGSGDVIEGITPKSRRDIIWRRLLNNLPYILKTKGTEECVRVLFSTYGIPHSLYSINEYSSIPSPTKTEAFYTFDNDYYALHYSGSGEYIKTDWDINAQSVEFKVSFDSEKLNPEGSVFRLFGVENNWVIGAIRDDRNDELGKMFFTVASDTGNTPSIETIVTDTVPLFNGSVYSVLLTRNDVDGDILLPVDYDCGETASLDLRNLVPTRYDLVVKRSENARMIVESSGSAYLDEVYNKSFSSTTGSNLYIGNFTQTPSNITPDTEAFYGTIDQVKVYRSAITEERFNSHVYYVDAYDIDDYSILSDDLVLHLKFNCPVDLYNTDGFVSITNNSISDYRMTNVNAYNFPFVNSAVAEPACIEEDCCTDPTEVLKYISKFPWQFKKFQTIEHIKVPSFGASTYKNNKISYDPTVRSGSLYTDVKSFVNDDLSVDIPSPSLGVFFSPTEEENKEILKFFGDFNIGDFIGNPSLIYQKQYHQFSKFKRNFYDKYTKIDFNDYMNIIRHYVDRSIYKNLENIVPARTKLKTGLLIESSILDRNKLQYKEITVNTQTHDATVNSSISVKSNPVFAVASSSTYNRTGLIDIEEGVGESRAQNLNQGVFQPNLDPELFSLFSYDGFITHKGSRYIPEIITENQIFSRRITHAMDATRSYQTVETSPSSSIIVYDPIRPENLRSDEWKDFTVEIDRLNLIRIPDEVDEPMSYYNNDLILRSSPKTRILNGYHKTHRINKRINTSGISKQTTYTTISDKDRLLNGKPPFESFEVDRGTINVATEADGVVLEGTD